MFIFQRPLVAPLLALATIATLVAVDTLKGIRMIWSIAITFTAPEPMPSKPDSVPAPNISAKPAFTRCARYFAGPSSDGYTPPKRRRAASEW